MNFRKSLPIIACLWAVSVSGGHAQPSTSQIPTPEVPLVGSGNIALDQIIGRTRIRMPDDIPESVCREIRKTGSDWRDPTQEMILSRCAEMGR